MKQKFWSWGDSFVIRNANDQEVYQVKGEVFTFGDKLSLQDMDGNELAFINQKLFSWGPTYEIYGRNGELAAVIKKELFTFFKCCFNVDVPGPNDLTAQGDFLDHEYQFTCGGDAIAYVSKQWFNWTDTYGIDIADGADGADEVLILASAVVIDMVCHDDHNNS